MRSFALALGTLVLGVGIGTPALANYVNDSSFETPSIPDGTRQAFKSGQTIGNWTVTGHGTVYLTSTDYTSKGFTFSAKDGKQWLNLGGKGQDTAMEQQVPAIQVYYIMKYFVGSVYAPNGGFGKSSTVIFSVNHEQQFPCTVQAKNDGTKEQQWTECSARFEATTSQRGKMIVTFTNGDPAGDGDCAIDQINLQIDNNQNPD